MKKSTVLIVDDDRDLLTAVRILLKTKVKRVLVEHNPENLLRILESEAVDETETKAWHKLLHVLTHEIMNSIAPISSLASCPWKARRERKVTFTLAMEH